MNPIRKNLRQLPIGFWILPIAWAGLFMGCQSEPSDPGPAILTPIDTTKPGSSGDRASLSLVSPKGGEIYGLGDSLRVIAKAEAHAHGGIDSVDIHLSPDGGQTWGAISDRSLSMDTDSSLDFSWKIPAAFTANGKDFSLAENSACMIRISQRNWADSLKTSTSGRFKVEDTVLIRLTHPLGGESFEVGDTVHIAWTTKFDLNNVVDAVDVKVSPDSGKTWAYLRPTSISPEDPVWGRVPWMVADSVTIRGKTSNLPGNPGVCIQVEQYSTSDPKARFRSGMISISRP